MNVSSKKGVLFISPMLVFLLLTTFLPIIYVIFEGFFRNFLPEKSVSFVLFKNYMQIFKDKEFLKSLYNTGVYVFFSVFFHVAFGLFMAMFLDKKGPLAGLAKIMRGIFITPWLLSWAVAASVWLLILNPAGVLNGFGMSLGLLHRQIPWFGEKKYAMAWIIFITIWKAFPFYMMFIYASLITVPQELYESASIDGANYIKKFYYVTLPHILPTLLTLTILDIVWSIRQFDIIFLTTGGGPVNSTETLSLYVYFTAFEKFRFGLASAQGVIIFLISSIPAFIYIKLYGKTEI